jgi:hypothetical protein
MATIKAYSVIEDFRASYQDRVEPFRHENAVLTVWLNDAIREIVNARPDALSSDTVVVALPAEVTDVSATGSNLPVNSLFKEACVVWLMYRAFDVDELQNQAAGMLQKFEFEIRR